MPFLVAAAIAFHLAVLAPLYVMALQGDQFALDQQALLGWPLLGAAAAASILGTILHFAARRHWFRVIAIVAAVGVYLYLQFYLLVWDFGPFDGRTMSFADFRLEGAVELVLLIALICVASLWPKIAAPLFSRFVTILFVASAGLGVWQFANAVPAAQKTPIDVATVPLASPNFYRDGRPLLPGITSVSREKNVIILLLDTLQSDVFEKVVMGDPALRKRFDGFTLFNNASGHFPFTGLSIPSILTGEPYENTAEKIPSYRERVAPKRIEAVLADHGFAASRIPLHSRGDFLSAQTGSCRNYGAVYDLFGFRQLPIALKPWFYDQGRFRLARLCSAIPATDAETDQAVFDKLIEGLQADSTKPTVKYLHFWGAHPPAMVTSTCEPRDKSKNSFGEFQGQAVCALHRVADYIDKLRSLGVFENTMMFVISDHGARYGFLKRPDGKGGPPGYVMSSATPSIAFHDFGDNRPFSTSPAPAMLADIYPTILAPLQISTQTFGTDLRKVAPDAKRERPYMFFRNAGDASGEYLSKIDRFVIRGNVHDPRAWAQDERDEQGSRKALPFDQLNFKGDSLSRFLGLGWSAEARGVAQSWVIASPASVTGILPPGQKLYLSMDILNPHRDQTVTIDLNGRELARWTFPEPVSWTTKTVEFMPTPEEIGAPVTFDVEVEKIIAADGGEKGRGIAVNSIKVESGAPAP